MLWHKHHESLGKSDVFIHVFISGCQPFKHHGGRTHKRSITQQSRRSRKLCESCRHTVKDVYSTYFTTMDTDVVLDTIPDKECAAFLECPEETADKVQQRVSSDSIPTGPEVTSKMHLHGNITSFDKKGQEAVTKLFGHLQDAHNHMAQVAQAVVQLSKVSSPEQFTFVLQLAVRPIIQLKIPPHLSAPTELKFEKERLTQEEITEENCCNLILP